MASVGSDFANFAVGASNILASVPCLKGRNQAFGSELEGEADLVRSCSMEDPYCSVVPSVSASERWAVVLMQPQYERKTGQIAVQHDLMAQLVLQSC